MFVSVGASAKCQTLLRLQDAMASFATAAISVGLLASASAHAANDNVWWLVRSPGSLLPASCFLLVSSRLHLLMLPHRMPVPFTAASRRY